MKKNIFRISAFLLSAALVFSGCHKKNDTTPDDSTQQATTAGDQMDVSNESNQTLEDANVALAGTNTGNARIAGTTSLIAGATIDSSNKANGIWIINYDGLTADGKRKRTGSVTIQISPATAKWSDVGTSIQLTFTNLKIAKVTGTRSITLNGTHTVTNLSGGDLRTLINGPSGGQLIHKVRGSLSITFDDGTVRSWSVARHKVLNKNSSSNYTFDVSGDTTINNITLTETWGINRKGESFYGAIPTTITLNSSCGWEAVSGVFVHHGPKGDLTITYGVNSDGSVFSGQGCPYGYKLEWIGLDGKAKKLIVQY